MRVLYAEDNVQDADLTLSHFSEHAPDIEVEVVPTGQACLDRLSTTVPDLVLLDHHLPDMEGLDVLRAAVRTGVAVPFVLVTGVGDEELVVQSLRLGASNYVPKSGDYLETLPDLLRAVVEKHRCGPTGGPRPQLLYVEHDAADVDLTLQHFADTAPRLQVEVIWTSEAALRRLERPPPLDAVLIDLRMPDLSGLEFVREAERRRLPLPPFIMLTGRGDEAAALASLKLGAAEYVTKREGYLERLVYVIDHAIAHERLNRLNQQLDIQLAERKRVEQALREADRRKDEFLGLLSHELRNPLAPISNSIRILERTLAGGEQAKRALAVMGRQVGHLTRLVDDLLDVTRLGRGKIHLELARVELVSIIARTVEDHRPIFAERGLDLELQAPAEPLFVKADVTRLVQLVGNLLQNAAKFTDPGGRTTVELSTDEAGDRAVLRVCDTGIGIPAETLPHVFEPFTQANHSLERTHGGLGLGLATVRGLVELHGGDVSAHSEGLGKGAELTVRLPMDKEEHTDSPARACPRAVARRRVLVIEDKVDAAQSLREVLELEGHAVEVADDGDVGLQKLRAGRFDVVLCDLGLPRMSGYEVARAVRADADLRDVTLIAVTGYAQPEEVARASEAGFDGHVAKPPSLDRLREVLAPKGA